MGFELYHVARPPSYLRPQERHFSVLAVGETLPAEHDEEHTVAKLGWPDLDMADLRHFTVAMFLPSFTSFLP